MRLGFLFLSSTLSSSSSSVVVGSSISRSIIRPAPSLLLHRPFHFISNRTTSGFQFPARTTLTASASSMASSFKPQQARVPPALQLPSPPITKFKIGLCQLAVTADKERNIVHARAAIEEAAEKGAKLVVLPEIWNSPYSNDSFPIYAEDIDAGPDASPSTAMLSEAARLLNITIVGGSIPERSGDKLYNTCCVFDADGKLKAKHRKIMSITNKDEVGPKAPASTTQEAAISEQTQLLGDRTSAHESLPCPVLPGPQIPRTNVAAGVSTPPVASTVVHVPPIPLPGTSEQDLRGAVQLLTQLVAAQVQGQNAAAPRIIQGEAAGSRVRDFLHMNPPVFTGSSVTEDPQQFIDEINRIFRVMHISETEAVELASYQLKDVAIAWYEMWVDSRGPNAPPAVWQEFSQAFMEHFLPQELREARVEEFLNFKQRNLSVREYSMRFTQLARFAPELVSTQDARKHRFVVGLGDHLIGSCAVAALNRDIDIARLMAHAQWAEDRIQSRRFEREREQNKRARTAGMSQGGDRAYSSRGPQKQSQSVDRSTASAPAQSSRPRHEQSQTSRAPGPRYQRGTSRGLPPRPTCRQCGRSHLGECRYGSTACYQCGVEGHKMRDCPRLEAEGKGERLQFTGSAGASSSSAPSSSRGPQSSAGRGSGRGRGSGSGAGPNRMYALADRQDSEASPDVVTGSGTRDSRHFQ